MKNAPLSISATGVRFPENPFRVSGSIHAVLALQSSNGPDSASRRRPVIVRLEPNLFMQVYDVRAPDDLRDTVAAIRPLHRVPVPREHCKELLCPQQVSAILSKRPDRLECDRY